MTDHELEKINKVRRQHGKSILSRQQIESIKSGESYRAARREVPDSGMDASGFLFGYLTGIPISPTRGISAESVVGSMLHDNSDTRQDSAGSQDTSSAADTSSSADTSSPDTSSPTDTSSPSTSE